MRYSLNIVTVTMRYFLEIVTVTMSYSLNVVTVTMRYSLNIVTVTMCNLFLNEIPAQTCVWGILSLVDTKYQPIGEGYYFRFGLDINLKI